MSEYMSQEHYAKAAIVVEPMVLCAQFPFCFGNVLKYVLRANYKGDTVGDLRKAVRYLEEHSRSPSDVENVNYKIKNDDTIRRLMYATENVYVGFLLRGEYKALKARLLHDIDLIEVQ